MMRKAIVRLPLKTGEKLAAEPSMSTKLVPNQKAVAAGAVVAAAAAAAGAVAVAAVVAEGATNPISWASGPVDRAGSH